MHDPAHAKEVAAARRIGGLRRRKETQIALAYDFESLESLEEIRRILEIAVFDTLNLENSLSRSRTLACLAQIASSLYEKCEVADRLRAIEAALGPRLQKDVHLVGGRDWR